MIPQTDILPCSIPAGISFERSVPIFKRIRSSPQNKLFPAAGVNLASISYGWRDHCVRRSPLSPDEVIRTCGGDEPDPISATTGALLKLPGGHKRKSTSSSTAAIPRSQVLPRGVCLLLKTRLIPKTYRRYWARYLDQIGALMASPIS